MKDLSLNLRGLRGYRRITPLSAGTLLWLNGCSGMSGQDKTTATGAAVGDAASAMLTGRSSAGDSAAHAANHCNTDLQTTRRSRTRGPR